MSEGIELLREMQDRNPDRVKKFFQKYSRFMASKGSSEGFFAEFDDYLAQQPKGRDGYKTISPFSFERFLWRKHKGIDSINLYQEDS